MFSLSDKIKYQIVASKYRKIVHEVMYFRFMEAAVTKKKRVSHCRKEEMWISPDVVPTYLKLGGFVMPVNISIRYVGAMCMYVFVFRVAL